MTPGSSDTRRSLTPSTLARGALARLLPVVLLVGLAAPVSASAHALFGDHDPNRPLIEYLTIGFGHMALGWDHLLFISGVVLLAGSLKTAAKLISLFVAGHSLTLLVATLAEWKLDATVVDVVIALSLVYVGIQGWRGRPESLRVFGAVVFGFGLVHGLGLSTRLQDLGLPESGLVERVLLFNVGVELGQLAALTVIVGIGTLLARDLGERRDEIRGYSFFAIAIAGLVAAAVISFPSEDSDKEEVVAGEQKTACTQEDTEPPQVLGGDHPAKQFFGPDEEAPEEDLTHVTGDGFVIVRYAPELPAADVARLEELVNDPASNQYVIAAADPEQDEPLRAVTARRLLSCTEADIAGLTAFRDEWFEYLQEQQGP